LEGRFNLNYSSIDFMKFTQGLCSLELDTLFFILVEFAFNERKEQASSLLVNRLVHKESALDVSDQLTLDDG